MTRKKVRPEDIAEQHWGYTAQVMEQSGVEKDLIERFHFVYNSAFLHGYKHAMDKKK